MKAQRSLGLAGPASHRDGAENRPTWGRRSGRKRLAARQRIHGCEDIARRPVCF